MNRYQQIKRPYQDAMSLFQSITEQDHICFLHSSSSAGYDQNQSIIGLFPNHIVVNDAISSAYSKLTSSSKSIFENLYIGHFSYEIKDEIETLPTTSPNRISPKRVCLVRYGLLLIFDHKQEALTIYYDDEKHLKYIDELKANKKSELIQALDVKANFNKDAYKKAVEHIKDLIIKGDVFEVNLTNKFTGTLKKGTDGKQIFENLVTYSPSQYSAYIKHDDLEIISSSPERFIHAEGNKISSKPIKGTRKRSKSPEIDAQMVEELKNSEKDLAENLMIVDLVRNDLGRVAKTGSVKVPELFKIESYQMVHQMVSTVECELDEKKDYLDLLLASFPPGSMTGAPKIRAMEIISELEKLDRGIYSGAIGIISPGKYLDLSVVIRTIIKQGDHIEFQAGGAIVFDSDPDEEYHEMQDKLAAISKVLNVDLKKME